MSERPLRDSLNDLAHEVADGGTLARREILEMLAAAIRPIAPGTAAALTDWTGSEVSRLRAFGFAHGVARHELAAAACATLAGQLTAALISPLGAPLDHEPRLTLATRQRATTRARRARPA